MTGDKFRFKIKIGAVETLTSAVFASGLNLVLSKDENDAFFREKLNGKLTFFRNDFDLINDESFETEFEVLMEKVTAGVWATRWTGFFYKADCDFDLNNESVEIQPEPKDVYKDLKNALSREFNLVELAPAITLVKYDVQPLFQIYYINEGPEDDPDFITNFTSGGTWEQILAVDKSTLDTGTLAGTYFFNGNQIKRIITGTGELTPDVSGEYDAGFLRLDGQYEINENIGATTWEIWDKFDSDNVVYETAPAGTIYSVFTATGGSGDTCRFFGRRMYTRYLHNDSGSGNAIPDPDIVAQNNNYTRATAIDLSSYFASDNHTTTPTQYGKFDENALYFSGEYFDLPTVGAITDAVFAVGRSGWEDFSLWVYLDASAKTVQSSFGLEKTLKHAYKLVDVISILLAEIDSTLTHAEDANHSDFLYAAGTNAIRGATQLFPLIAPKTNIIIGDYDQPANRAKIRFQDIIDIIQFAYKCDWYIDSLSRFRIEHISFFENGYTYSGQNIDLDLTTALEPRTLKKWSFDQDKYSYEKSQMPERFEFNWMDTVSIPFRGYPIEIQSQFVEKGNIKQLRLSIFTSDLDFIIGQSSDIVKEGFAFLEAIDVSGDLVVQFVEVEVGILQKYNLQNGHLSFLYMHNQYFKHGLPASSVKINNEIITATSIKRRKIQAIDWAENVDNEPNYESLVTSELGTGEIQEAVINIDSGNISMVLRHDTD